MKTNIALFISAISLVGILYQIYYQNVALPKRLKECNDIAIEFEKTRHAPVDDLMVTNQDISSYMKNMSNCLAY